MNQSRGIVVGTAIGYGYAEVAPFVESLRDTGFEGPVILALADTVSRADLDELAERDVRAHLVKPTPWIASSRTKAARATRGVARTVGRNSARLALTIQGPLSRRWLVYPEMARAFADLFGAAPWLFLTDVRDVHFQADPGPSFDALAAAGPLHLFAEGAPGADTRDPERAAGSTRIADQRWNADWIEYLGGSDLRAQLRDCQVLCAGTILVAPSHLDALADGMVGVMGHNRTRTAPLGVDQGALNFLVHTGRLDSLGPVVHPNVDGGVFTMATCPADSWAFTGGRVLVDAAPPAVVHQYDRFPELLTAWNSGSLRAQ